MENFTTKKESTKIEEKNIGLKFIKFSQFWLFFFKVLPAALNVYFLFSQKGHQKLSLFLLFDKWPKNVRLGSLFKYRYNLNKETQHRRSFFKFSRIFILLYPGFTLLVRIGTRARMQYCIRISVRARSMNNRLAICNTLGFYLHSLVFTSYLKLICTYTS